MAWGPAMRFQLDRYQAIKNYIHTFHAIVLFLAIVLTFAVFTRDGKSDGRLGWYFGLCFLSIPALIYLVMVPMWSRARKFANVYAFATIDTLSAVCWFSAWAGTAAYVTSGKGKGGKKNATGCDDFKYGSPGRCKLSTGVTILGVFMMLGFCATAFLSFRAVMYYKREGTLPNQEVGKSDFDSQTQDAFSSNLHNNELEDAEQDSAHGTQRGYHQPLRDEEYPPVYQNDDDEDGLGQYPHQPISPLGQHGLGLGQNQYTQDSSFRGSDPVADYASMYIEPAPSYTRQ